MRSTTWQRLSVFLLSLLLVPTSCRLRIPSSRALHHLIFPEDAAPLQETLWEEPRELGRWPPLLDRLRALMKWFPGHDASRQVRVTTGENGESPRTFGNYGICDSDYPDVSESSRLHASLKKENVPAKRLVVNQILLPSASDCKFCAMKRKDQMRALDMIHNDSELSA